jgi:hypothetical protein
MSFYGKKYNLRVFEEKKKNVKKSIWTFKKGNNM